MILPIHFAAIAAVAVLRSLGAKSASTTSFVRIHDTRGI